MDLFEKKGINPMLIGLQKEPFDDEDYIFELKLDGVRCIAYLEPAGTDLRNKRDLRLLPKVPELSEIHKQVKGTCILDGELSVIQNGRTDFYEIQKRVMTANQTKIRLAALRHPACFTAFDILYLDGKETNMLPLMERKQLLKSVVLQEDEHFAVTRYIEGQGKALFDLTGERRLEGIVAKKKDSKYFFDKRTKDWIKIKNMVEEDLVVCGFIMKESHLFSLVLGKWDDGVLHYEGHVTLGVSAAVVEQLGSYVCSECPFGHTVPKGNENAVWLKPKVICTVEYMADEREGRRQMVFRGIRKGMLE